MAKLHHNVEATDLLRAVQTFLATCRSPALVEDGEPPIALLPGSYAVEIRSGRLFVEAGAGSRIVSRRLIGIQQQRPGILDCLFHRFGGAEGRVSFLDLDRPQTSHRRTTAARRSFAEQFRRMLHRQFPQWDVPVLSSSMDLRRSFSPLFPRAVLRRGRQAIAAIACPDPQKENELLTFALLWFDHVCQIPDTQTSLSLFLPEGSGCLTAHRLRWLRNELLRTRVFLFNEHGAAGVVDPNDLGNLETSVSRQVAVSHLSDALNLLIREVTRFPHVGVVPELSGGISLRFKGCEFARIEHGSLKLGLEEQIPLCETDFHQVGEFVLHLNNLQSAPALPERWLESAVRTNLQTIDPHLLSDPVHGQVLTFAGRDRDAVDLLAASPSGQLTVLELKASEDLHLPMQALDYWIRIKWHAERRELGHLFRGIELAELAPKLVLLAPALSFHSANVTVLRYFSPQVEVERVGVNSDWSTQFRVVMRLTGANTPISHGSLHGNPRHTEHPERAEHFEP